MLDYVFPWIRKRPGLASLAGGVVLVVLGHLFEKYGILTPLTQVTQYLYDSLSSFDATRVGTIFYRELTGCEVVENGIACVPGPDTTDQLRMTLEGQQQPGMLTTLFLAVINTVGFVFANSTWLGIIIYLLTVAASIAILLAMVEDGGGFLGFLVFVLIAPALSTLIALAMKWVLLLFVMLFSEVLAGVAWIIVTFGSFFTWLNMGHQVLSHAHQLDSLASADTTKVPPPPDGNA
jgi:hypothetical protein